MELDIISHRHFQLLHGSSPVIESDANAGCAWYASKDRRILSMILLDDVSELWVYVIYFAAEDGWAELESGSEGAETWDDAEHQMMLKIQQADAFDSFVPVISPKVPSPATAPLESARASENGRSPRSQLPK